MKNRIGTNQFRIKSKYNFWSSLWFIAFVTTILVWTVQPKIISPCPDSGCFVPNVYATDLPQTLKDKLAIAALHAFGPDNIVPLFNIVEKESQFNQFAINASSGACGLFQSNPCSKMKCSLQDVDCQIAWGISYIKARYGNAQNAWNFWKVRNWY